MAKARFAMSALVKGPKARVAFPLEAKAWDVQVMRRGDKLAAEVVREHGGRDWRSLQPAAEIVMDWIRGSFDYQCELWVGLDFKSMMLLRRKERGNG